MSKWILALIVTLGLGVTGGYWLGYQAKDNRTVRGAVAEQQTQMPEASASEQASASPPAYLMVLGEVKDRPAFMEGYANKLAPVYAQYGGEYLALGGGPLIEVLEGDYAPPSYVISKWPSMDAARAFWASPEYEPLLRARIDNDWGDFNVLLVQGVPAPQSDE